MARRRRQQGSAADQGDAAARRLRAHLAWRCRRLFGLAGQPRARHVVRLDDGSLVTSTTIGMTQTGRLRRVRGVQPHARLGRLGVQHPRHGDQLPVGRRHVLCVSLARLRGGVPPAELRAQDRASADGLREAVCEYRAVRVLRYA